MYSLVNSQGYLDHKHLHLHLNIYLRTSIWMFSRYPLHELLTLCVMILAQAEVATIFGAYFWHWYQISLMLSTKLTILRALV